MNEWMNEWMRKATKVHMYVQCFSFVQRLRNIRHSQATSIRYTFLVADYWSSTAILSCKQLRQFTLQHIPRIPQCFIWQQCFFRRPTSSKGLVPRPHPAFRRFQYHKAGRAWYLFSREHDVIRKIFALFHFRVLYWTQTKEQEMGEAWERG